MLLSEKDQRIFGMPWPGAVDTPDKFCHNIFS